MSLTYNNTAVKKITLNGDDVKHLDYNGTRTWDAYRTMTVYIDESVEDPELACTYGDDAIGMTPGSDAWDDFFGHYPCMLKDGVEGQKLQRNDFTKHEDGTAADITSGDEGDVMICFPRRGLTISKTGTIVKITMTDDPNAITNYNAHTEMDKFYIGAYSGALISNKLRSLAGKSLDRGAYSMRIGKVKEYAHNNEIDSSKYGYRIVGFYQLVYIQAMYILKYKNLDSASAVGFGYERRNNSPMNTGGTEIKGMDWGENTGTEHMKLFGIEDLWGNIKEFTDVIDIYYNPNITGGHGEYYKNGNAKKLGYIYDTGHGYVKRVYGTTELGFLPIAMERDTNTSLYCNYCSIRSSKGYSNFAYMAYGYGGTKESLGIFSIEFWDDGTGQSYGDTMRQTARLMYCSFL